jgi:hypothetical protein
MSKNIVQPLSTSDFSDYFTNVPDLSTHWIGVRPLDQIPKQIKLKKFVIVNTSVKSQREGHWIVLSRPHKGTLELFNSLGYHTIDAIKPYLNFPFKTEIIYNNSPVQKPYTSSCGLYCIYFAVYRYFNLDMPLEELMEDIFTTDLNKNEQIVYQFCRHLLNLSNPHDLFLLDF